MLVAPWPRARLIVVLALAASAGAAVAVHYGHLGLTLTHYDARGHLIVARRIFDSITPGWQQIGAVWLPLPHLLNALPVQVDGWYRTGASAVALSVLSFAVACAAVAWMAASITGTWTAAAAALAVFALNPNVLYLQATPMTEPLLMALIMASMALLMTYCERLAADATAPAAGSVGLVMALACLTRYEAWPVIVGALVVAIWVLVRRGASVGNASRAVARVAAYPVGAIVGFSVFSRVVVGSWFASGFFVPENTAEGHPWEAVAQIVWGLRELSGTGLMVAAGVGGVALAVLAFTRRRAAVALLPLALAGTAAVPWSAFIDGHPYRIRYMVPLIAAQAVWAGVAAGIWRRGRIAGLAAILLLAAVELRPLSLDAPMVVEAGWDRPNIAARAAVTSCLEARAPGDTVMASMGSLGHYMQDLSKAGFSIRDFLHEGNGDIWLNALDAPRPYVGWILIEEKAEGGDMLAQRARQQPGFLHGYHRVCEAAGLALYRRDASN